MDNLHPQSGGHEHQEESDLSIRGIVIFGVFLVVGGVLSFVAAHYLLVFFAWGERAYFEPQVQMTSTAEQNSSDRQAADKKSQDAMDKAEAGTQQSLEDIERRNQELHVRNTFPEPRLQYYDVRDMDDLRQTEDKQLDATGPDENGNLRIPVDQAITVLAKRGLPPVSGTFIPVNMAPTSVIVPPVAPPRPQPGNGAAR